MGAVREETGVGGCRVWWAISNNELEETIALGNAWQPTFDSKAFDYDKAQNYLNEVGDFGEYSSNDIAPDYWI